MDKRKSRSSGHIPCIFFPHVSLVDNCPKTAANRTPTGMCETGLSEAENTQSTVTKPAAFHHDTILHVNNRHGLLIPFELLFISCCVFFFFGCLLLFNLPFGPPEDLRAKVECTLRATQWNKSITHSITVTAGPAG